jgi:hypothetical protein
MLSCEGLDDLVGKKIVLRSSWDNNADYLFYNYRDVGMYGRSARENLINSIPVHAEKPHHGHADEQSIAALCANGAVFLRDGGYRDKLLLMHIIEVISIIIVLSFEMAVCLMKKG